MHTNPRFVTLVAGCFAALALACGDSSERADDTTSVQPPSADTTQVLRQRLVYYESVRSFGDDFVPNATRHPDPRVRRAAAMALGRIQDAAALEFLLPLLDDPDESVIRQAAWAIRQLQGLSESQRHRAQSALTIQLEMHDKDELWPFLEALAPHAGPASVDPVGKWIAGGLLAGIGSEARPPRTEGMAALVLGGLDTPRAVRTLAAVGDLGNREHGAAWRIARAMTLHPDSTYLPSLRSLIAHEHPYARAAGVRALGTYEDAASLEQIYPLLSDFEWEVRASALRALGDIGDEAARPFVVAMTGDAHPLVREAALLALEKLGVGERIDLVVEFLTDDVPAVRLTALRLVATARGAAAREAWDAARRDDVDFVRSEALRSTFDVLGVDAATSLLVETLQGGSVRERSTAATALGERADEIPAARRDAVRTALEAALGDADFVVASVAAGALGELGDLAAFPALRDAYQTHDRTHHDVDVRWAAVGALVDLAEQADASARSALAGFFETASADPDVRIAHDARRGLAHLAGDEEPSPPPARARPAPATPATLPEIDLGRVRVGLVTRHGTTVLELHGNDYPRTVASFLANIDAGFYDNGVFHRVVPAFVVQGGCPRGDGWGDAGALLPCEYGDLRYDSEGVVGMAHAGRDTGGSQFFITHLPVPRLDGRYTAFGRVVDGMEFVDRIVRGDSFRLERLPRPTP